MTSTRYPVGFQLDKVQVLSGKLQQQQRRTSNNSANSSLSSSGAAAARRPPSPSLTYTESDVEVEPSSEDIEEFARRIGIEPANEPHLLHLARSGLLEKLPPEWKPCKDPQREVWFYYNTETRKSQWEHPMDAVYKQRVIEARTEHAMNRLETFDLSTAPKPLLKSLPPLKKGGGGLAPLGSLHQPLLPSSNNKPAPLGPLRNTMSFSSSEDLSQGSMGLMGYRKSDGLQHQQPLELLGGGGMRKSASSGELLNGGTNGKPMALTKHKVLVDGGGNMGPAKKSGLTLTGAGASFLKSANKPPAENGPSEPTSKSAVDLRKSSLSDEDNNSKFFKSQVPDPYEDQEDDGSEVGFTKPVLPDPQEKKPLKTDPEHNMWSNLNSDTGLRKKPNVKFDLEDPKLTFEFDRDESDEENESEKSESGTSEEDDDEDEGEYDEDRYSATPDGRPKSAASSAASIGPDRPVGGLNRIPMTVTVPLAKPASEPSDPVLDRATLKDNADKQIQEYKAKIQDDQREQQRQLQTEMESRVEQFKADMEATIQRTKDQFEDHKRSEIDKARSRMETTLTTDLEKIRREFSDKLELKKVELQREHEKAVDNLKSQNQAKIQDLHSDPRLAQAERDYEIQLSEEIRKVKSNMDLQHRKQIEDLKTLHRQTIENLKVEFKAEEEKLRTENAQLITEMLSKFEQEKQFLIESFQAEQEKIRQDFSTKALQLTQEFTRNFNQLRQDLQSRMDSMKAESEGPNASPASQDLHAQAMDKAESLTKELAEMRQKYTSLEEKYMSLNKRISSHPNNNNESAVIVVPNPSTDDSFPVHYPTGLEDLNNTIDSGAAESDSSFSSCSVSGRKNTSKRSTNAATTTANPDVLTKALSVLDELKNQISELKHEQQKMRQVVPAERPLTAVKTRSKSHKEVHAIAATSSSKRSSSKSVVQNPPPAVFDDKKFVSEARDFIKSQKFRLSRPGVNAVPTPVGLKQRQQQVLKVRSEPEGLHTLIPDHHSETDSSGVGSLKELSNTINSNGSGKNPISQDIEGILSSLQQLDGQMKHLWSHVGTSDALMNSPRSLGLPPFQQHASPLRQMQLGPAATTLTPGAAAGLVQSLRTSPYNPAHPPMVSTLNEHINNLRNRQNRILRQYPLIMTDPTATSTAYNTRSTNIMEKTKDLREWLDKF